MPELDAYLEGVLYGRFTSGEGTSPASFTYATDAPDSPISLSLPRNGSATRNAASNLLENFLPDRSAARQQMADAFGAASARTFDLLAAAGGDVAGGLVLVPAGQAPDDDGVVLDPALDRDIAARIAAIKRDPDGWAPPDRPARFLLAGAQGKFALVEIDGDWYWSNRSLPSTHIIKPAAPRFPGLEVLESQTLQLAQKIGLPASESSVLGVADQTAFIVERFDRVDTGALTPTRIHAEDLAQASGISPDAKYRLGVADVITLLRSASSDETLVVNFLRQLAFNMFVGNFDAHAKNYSLLLRPSGIELSPLYDTVPVLIYPEYDQRLAMDISGARTPQAVSMDHWRKLARTNDLDPDRVVHEVTAIGDRIEASLPEAWLDVAANQRDQLLAGVRRNIGAARRDSRSAPPKPATKRKPKGAPESADGQFARRERPDGDVALTPQPGGVPARGSIDPGGGVAAAGLFDRATAEAIAPAVAGDVDSA